MDRTRRLNERFISQTGGLQGLGRFTVLHATLLVGGIWVVVVCTVFVFVDILLLLSGHLRLPGIHGQGLLAELKISWLRTYARIIAFLDREMLR